MSLLRYLLPENLYRAWSISSGQIERTHQVPCADHGYGYWVVCLSIYMSPLWSVIAVTVFSVQLKSRDVGGIDDDDRKNAIRAVWCACAKRSGISAPVRGEVLTPEQRRPVVFIRGDCTSVGRLALPPVCRRHPLTPRPRLRHGGEITSGCTTANGIAGTRCRHCPQNPAVIRCYVSFHSKGA